MAHMPDVITEGNAGSLSEIMKWEGDFPVTGLGFLQGGQVLAAGYLDDKVRVWRLPDLGQLKTLTGHIRYKTEVLFSPDGELIASYVGDGATNKLQFWKLTDGSALPTPDTGFLDSVAFSPDGKFLAVADRALDIWRLSDLERVQSFRGHDSYVNAIDWTTDGRLLAYGAGNSVFVWQVADGKMLHNFSVTFSNDWDDNEIWSVRFLPNRNLVIAGTAAGVMQGWDLATGQMVFALKAHDNVVGSLAVSPAADLLASGSWDCAIKLWHVPDMTLLRTLNGHTSQVDYLQFSPDGRFLASGSWDKTVRLWAVS